MMVRLGLRLLRIFQVLLLLFCPLRLSASLPHLKIVQEDSGVLGTFEEQLDITSPSRLGPSIARPARTSIPRNSTSFHSAFLRPPM
jgi:hypothetical protein